VISGLAMTEGLKERLVIHSLKARSSIYVSCVLLPCQYLRPMHIS